MTTLFRRQNAAILFAYFACSISCGVKMKMEQAEQEGRGGYASKAAIFFGLNICGAIAHKSRSAIILFLHTYNDSKQ